MFGCAIKLCTYVPIIKCCYMLLCTFLETKETKKIFFTFRGWEILRLRKILYSFVSSTHHKKIKRPTNLLFIHHSSLKSKQPTNLPYTHSSSQKNPTNKNIKLTFYPFFFPFNNSYSNTNLNSHPDYIKIVKKEVTSLPVTVVSVNIDLTPVVVVMLVVNTITVHYLISFTQVISVKLV